MLESLDVLHLLPDALYQGPRLQDARDHLGVVGLRRDGVHLAMKLLREKVELAAHGAARADQSPELREMRAEPGELLGHVVPGRPRRDFLRQAAGIGGRLTQDDLDAIPEARLDPRERRR